MGAANSSPAALRADLLRVLSSSSLSDAGSVDRVRALLQLGVDLEAAQADADADADEAAAAAQSKQQQPKHKKNKESKSVPAESEATTAGGHARRTSTDSRGTGPASPVSPSAAAGSPVAVGPGSTPTSLASVCRAREHRMRVAGRVAEADRCGSVAKMLEDRASELLLSAARDGDLPRIQRLRAMGGDIYGGVSSGDTVVGVLGAALHSPKVTLGLVQYLLRSHVGNRAAVLHAATQAVPPKPLHLIAGLPDDVRNFLRLQISHVLLQLPDSVPAGKGDEGPDAIALCGQAKRLIRGGADSTLTNPQGHSVIARAVAQQHVTLLRQLLTEGVDANWVHAKTGQTLMELAEAQTPFNPKLIAALKRHTYNVELQATIKALETIKPETRQPQSKDRSHSRSDADADLDMVERIEQQQRRDQDQEHKGHTHPASASPSVDAASDAGSKSSASSSLSDALEQVRRLLTLGADIHCVNSNLDAPLAQLVLSLAKRNTVAAAAAASVGSKSAAAGEEKKDDECADAASDAVSDSSLLRSFISEFRCDLERSNAQGHRALELAVLFDADLRMLHELLLAGSALTQARSKESILAFARRAPESTHKDATVHLIQSFLNRTLLQTISKSANRRGKGHAALIARITELVRIGADINAHSIAGDDDSVRDGFTPLCIVAAQGDATLLSEMLRLGADPSVAARDEHCSPSLVVAAQAGQLDQVQLLLQQPIVDRNVVTARNESALHIAAAAGNLRMTQMLVAAGCDVECKNVDGLTAREVAEEAEVRAAAAPAPVPASASSPRAGLSSPRNATANSSATSPRGLASPRRTIGSTGVVAQHALVVSFLRRCDPLPAAVLAASPVLVLRAADPRNVDVCRSIPAPPAPTFPTPTGAEDLDPHGDTPIKGISGTPNQRLRLAAKKGDLQAAQVAISEGADVRRTFKGEGDRAAFHIASMALEAEMRRNNAGAATDSSSGVGSSLSPRAAASSADLLSPSESSSPASGSVSSGLKQVVDYLSRVATTHLRHALEQGHAGRVAAYAQVGATLEGLVPLAVSHGCSCEVLNLLLREPANVAALWECEPAQSPFAVATSAAAASKAADQLAALIQSTMTVVASIAVARGDLPRTQACILAGGLPDLEGAENVDAALRSGNEPLVRFLLNAGARLPARFKTVDDIQPEELGHKQGKPAVAASNGHAATTQPVDIQSPLPMSPALRSFLRQRFLDRAARVASACGDLDALRAAHRQGANLSAHNSRGVTSLTLSLLHTQNLPVVHYLVSRGCTLLHRAELPSCLQLARLNGHQPGSSLLSFLQSSLSLSMFDAVMAGDMETCSALSGLGANLSSVDEAGNGLVHAAVQSQGGAMVRWLCTRGAPLNKANKAGDYPIHTAVQKGDAASTKWILASLPTSTRLVNAQGQTALDLAKTAKFNRIVQLLDPGNKEFLSDAAAGMDGEDDEDDAARPPSLDDDELLHAASVGQVELIEAFVQEVYASLHHKRDLCTQLIAVAEQQSQAEVLRLLRPHLKSLTSEVSSDQTSDRLLSASAQQRVILVGFLTGLTGMIAGGEVELDASDPSTYVQLMQNMAAAAGTKTEFLIVNQAKPLELSRDAARESEQLHGRLSKLEHDLKSMSEQRATMQRRIQEQSSALAACTSAQSKKECYKETQDLRDQMATLQSSVSLFQSAAESARRKKQTLDALKSQPKLLTCYRTIENRLEGLFLATKSASSGMMQLNMTEQGDKRMRLVNLGVDLAELVPLIGGVLAKVINRGVGGIVSHMDASRQQNEIKNICMLGSIEELNKAASNAAALVTFYYSSVINAVSTDLTGDATAAESIPAFAEYLVLCMISSLRRGDVVPGSDLSTQLWMAAASQDCLKPQSLMDRLLGTPGDRTVSVIPRNIVSTSSGSTSAVPATVKVSLRALLGTVAVVDHEHTLFVPPAATLMQVTKVKGNLFQPFYTCCYSAAFTSPAQVQLLCERRGLVVASAAERDLFLGSTGGLSHDELLSLSTTVSLFSDNDGGAQAECAVLSPRHAAAAGEGASGEAAPSSAGSSAARLSDVARTSHLVHSHLHAQGLIVDRSEMATLIQQHSAERQAAIALEIDAMRECLTEKHAFMQASIDAATEQITADSERIKREQQELAIQVNRDVTKALAEQPAAFAKALAAQAQQQEERLALLMKEANAVATSLRADCDTSRAAHLAAVASCREELTRQQLAQEQQLAEVTAQSQAALAALQAEHHTQTNTLAKQAQTQLEQASADASAALDRQSVAHASAVASTVAAAEASRVAAESARVSSQASEQEASALRAASSIAQQSFKDEMALMQAAHLAALESQRQAVRDEAATHAQLLVDMQSKHEAAITAAQVSHGAQMAEQAEMQQQIRSKHDAEMQTLRDEHNAGLAAAHERSAAIQTAADRSAAAAAATLVAMEDAKSKMQVEITEARETSQRAVADASAALASAQQSHAAQLAARDRSHADELALLHSTAEAKVALAREKHEDQLRQHKADIESAQRKSSDAMRVQQAEHAAAIAAHLAVAQAAEAASRETSARCEETRIASQQLQSQLTTELAESRSAHAATLAQVSADQACASAKLAADHAASLETMQRQAEESMRLQAAEHASALAALLETSQQTQRQSAEASATAAVAAASVSLKDAQENAAAAAVASNLAATSAASAAAAAEATRALYEREMAASQQRAQTQLAAAAAATAARQARLSAAMVAHHEAEEAARKAQAQAEEAKARIRNMQQEAEAETEAEAREAM